MPKSPFYKLINEAIEVSYENYGVFQLQEF